MKVLGVSSWFGRDDLAFWRDADNRRRQFGFKVWLTGAEVHLGRRMYRCRWAWR